MINDGFYNKPLIVWIWEIRAEIRGKIVLGFLGRYL